MKVTSIRIPDELADHLSKEGDNMTFTIISSLNALRAIRNYSMKELSGIFTPEEWIFFADCFNGTIIDGKFRCSVDMLIAHCEDAESLEGGASRCGINIEKLVNKINKLTSAQVEALYYHVEKFWSNDNRNLNAWSKSL